MRGPVDKNVITSAAVHGVGTRTGKNRVFAFVAVERVIAIPAIEQIFSHMFVALEQPIVGRNDVFRCEDRSLGRVWSRPGENASFDAATVGFGVEHGCEESPTIALDIELPEGLTDAEINALIDQKIVRA